MKKTLFKASLILMSGALIFTSCNKKDKTTPDDTSQQTTTASDQSNVDTETNTALNDADIAVSGSANNAKIAATYYRYDSTSICNAVIDSVGNGLYDINYYGKSADSLRKRTGTISIQVEGTNGATSKWSTAGSTIIITYKNYKVTRVLTGKSITINGADTLTNVNGGNWLQLWSGATSSLTHTRVGTLSITFDDGTIRIWRVTKQRVANRISSTDYTITVSGTGSANGYNNIAYTGTNRFGNTFTGVFSTPIVWEYNYAWTSNIITWIPVSGTVDHYGAKGGLVVNFGVDNSGTAVASGTLPYGYKLNWTGLDGKTKTAILPY